jgi:hypothetical protein
MKEQLPSKERLQSPKRYFLDAPKEQPGTCFVKNDDYVLALDEIERLQREVRDLFKACTLRAFSPKPGDEEYVWNRYPIASATDEPKTDYIEKSPKNFVDELSTIQYISPQLREVVEKRLETLQQRILGLEINAATSEPPFAVSAVERLAQFIYDKEAKNCKSLDEALQHKANWRRAIPEATEMLKAAFPEGATVPPSDVHAKLREAQERISWAWSIIANVSGGDWSKQSQDWQDAAAQWEQIGDPYEGLASRDSTTVTKETGL